MLTLPLWTWLAIAAAWVLAALGVGILVGRAITAADHHDHPRPLPRASVSERADAAPLSPDAEPAPSR